MKQLKAFTIIEMLVVLVLSAVVFGIAASAWLYFEKLENKINTSQSYLLAFNKFDYLIKNDVNNANEINGNETDLYFDINNQHQKIHYQFFDTSIVRNQEDISDTLNIYYTKKYQFAKKSNDLISKIDIVFKLYNDSIPKSYIKWYDNKTLLEHSDN